MQKKKKISQVEVPLKHLLVKRYRHFANFSRVFSKMSLPALLLGASMGDTARANVK